jgi:hypothetical protein
MYHPHFVFKNATLKDKLFYILTEIICLLLLPILYVVGIYCSIKNREEK